MTIDEAVAICEGLVSSHPQMADVANRIRQLEDERDNLHAIAEKALSDCAWERSDMKKWADKQKTDPDND